MASYDKKTGSILFTELEDHAMEMIKYSMEEGQSLDEAKSNVLADIQESFSNFLFWSCFVGYHRHANPDGSHEH